MALLPNINVGSAPNDGTGSSLRDAFTIVNENFQFIEAFFPNSSVANLVANIESTGTSTFNYINANNISVLTLGNAGTLITGNIVTADQPNITSLGNLTSLSVAGDLTVSGNTSLETVIAENQLTANAILIAASSFLAQADVEFRGSQNVNVNVVSGSYTVSNSDYILQANVTGNANCTITLPNANINSGRVLKVFYYDEDAVNANTTVVTLSVEIGAGNIIIGPTLPSQTGLSIANDDLFTSVDLVSNGTYWVII